MMYEFLLARLRDIRRPAARAAGRKPHVGPADIFVLSALSKIGATLVTYPLLVVKSRLQVRMG
jgi:adenine nucleotide transporter 17